MSNKSDGRLKSGSCVTLQKKLIISMVIVAFLLSMPLVSPVSGDKDSGNTWSRIYQPAKIGHVAIRETSDGGFVASGQGFGGWVMKANLAGDPEWSRYYLPMGYSDADAGSSIRPTRDGGYIVAGAAEPIGRSLVQGWLLKLDPSGSVQWSKTFAGPVGEEAFFQADQTIDGGYVAVGNTASFGYPPGHFSNGWVLKLDQNGNVVWQKAFGGEDISSVDETSDGGFVVAGTVGVEGRAEAWVFKLDVSGSIVWARAFEAAVRTEAYSVQQTHDGGYVVAGEAVALTTYGSLESSSALLLRLDSKGNLLWEKSFGGSGFSRPSSIVETFDRGFVITGSSRPASSGTGIRGPWLLKLDAKGNLVWQKVYGGANDHLLQAQETRDKGFIAAGALATYCCGYQAWVLKLDSEGNIGDCPVGAAYNATLTDPIATMATPTVTSVTTNATSNEVSVMVTNNSSSTQTQCIGTRDGDKEQHHDEAPD